MPTIDATNNPMRTYVGMRSHQFSKNFMPVRLTPCAEGSRLRTRMAQATCRKGPMFLHSCYIFRNFALIDRHLPITIPRFKKSGISGMCCLAVRAQTVHEMVIASNWLLDNAAGEPGRQA